MKVKCANKSCGLIYDDSTQSHMVKVSAMITECHCPRCDGKTYYKLKPGEVEKPKTGAQLIALERGRQIKIEGYTARHDDAYIHLNLSAAAICYVVSAQDRLITPEFKWNHNPPFNWPWASQDWKPSADPIRDLVKAGALIAAEIDRIQRKPAKA